MTPKKLWWHTVRTAAALTVVLAGASLASADEVPTAPDTPAPKPPATATPGVTAPGATAPASNPAPIDIVVKPTKRPGSVLHIPAPTQGQYAEKPKVSKTPALIATTVTGAMLALSVGAYLKYESVHKSVSTVNDSDPLNGLGSEIDRDLERRQARIDGIERWKTISLGMFAGTLISASITGYLWSRHDAQGPSVNLEPNNSGFSFMYHGTY